MSIGGQTFIEWFVDEYYGGPAGIGNKNIIGFYIDDDWGNMNANGPSEMDGHAMEDMGLTSEVRRFRTYASCTARRQPASPSFPAYCLLDDWTCAQSAQQIVSSQDLKTIVPAYNWVANTVYHAIQQKGKWAWDLFLNNDPNCIVSDCRLCAAARCFYTWFG